MRALIFASGRGVRMGNLAGRLPKPLLGINGRPLISRIIGNLAKAGITQVCITLGYNGEAIRKQLGARQGTIRINYIENKEWEKGNIYSLYSSRQYFKDKPFLVCMGDHLCSVDFLKKLLAKKSPKAVVVALDKKMQPTQDDMKVSVDKRILEFGKSTIGEYVDTGFFICTPKVFDYTEIAITKEKYELSDCMNVCAKEGDIDFIDITGEFWLDIDTPHDLLNFHVVNI